MSMKRYLLRFGYIGKQFSGLQRQIPRDRPNSTDVATVQGVIEYGLKRMYPKNEVILQPSSRTDQGVHAINSSAHVDLEFDKDYDAKFIVHALNNFFTQTGVDVRILDAIEVSPYFSARALPQWRQYLYRFAVLNRPTPPEGLRRPKNLYPLPITEAHRCHFVFDPNWDVDLARKASKIFEGTQDFRTFMSKAQGTPTDIKTVRTIMNFDLLPGKPFLNTVFSNDWTFWQVRVRGKSFLYKQVRRMVSSLIAVGGKKITGADIRYMLENPDQSNWNPLIHTIPGHGLYLEDIHYDPKDYWIEAPIDTTEPEVDDRSQLQLIRCSMEILLLPKLELKQQLRVGVEDVPGK